MRKYKSQSVKFFSSDGNTEKSHSYTVYKFGDKIKETFVKKENFKDENYSTEEKGYSINKGIWKIENTDSSKNRYRIVKPYCDVKFSELFKGASLYSRFKEPVVNNGFIVKKSLIKTQKSPIKIIKKKSTCIKNKKNITKKVPEKEIVKKTPEKEIVKKTPKKEKLNESIFNDEKLNRDLEKLLNEFNL